MVEKVLEKMEQPVRWLNDMNRLSGTDNSVEEMFDQLNSINKIHHLQICMCH